MESGCVFDRAHSSFYEYVPKKQTISQKCCILFGDGISCIIISYGLMGIVLSTYRYKNIYPRHPETGFMSINSKVKKVS